MTGTLGLYRNFSQIEGIATLTKINGAATRRAF
jgi:hypothetical protein